MPGRERGSPGRNQPRWDISRPGSRPGNAERIPGSCQASRTAAGTVRPSLPWHCWVTSAPEGEEGREGRSPVPRPHSSSEYRQIPLEGSSCSFQGLEKRGLLGGGIKTTPKFQESGGAFGISTLSQPRSARSCSAFQPAGSAFLAPFAAFGKTGNPSKQGPGDFSSPGAKFQLKGCGVGLMGFFVFPCGLS